MGYFVGCFNYDYIAIAQGNVAFGTKNISKNITQTQITMKYSPFQNIRYKKNKRDIVDTSSIWRNEAKKYLCLGRNAIVVILGTVLAYVLNVYDIHPFTLTGKIFEIFGCSFSFDIEHRTYCLFKLFYR